MKKTRKKLRRVLRTQTRTFGTQTRTFGTNRDCDRLLIPGKLRVNAVTTSAPTVDSTKPTAAKKTPPNKIQHQLTFIGIYDTQYARYQVCHRRNKQAMTLLSTDTRRANRRIHTYTPNHAVLLYSTSFPTPPAPSPYKMVSDVPPPPRKKGSKSLAVQDWTSDVSKQGFVFFTQ